MSMASANSIPMDAEVSGAKWQVWTGRALSTLAVLFLLFDAAGKFMMPVQVVQACQRLDFPSI